MHTDDRNQRVNALVEAYLTGEAPLQDYLGGVDHALRDEVRAQCEEALFVRRYFDGLPPPPAHAEVPQRIGGCELQEPIGTGAMGQVFRARQTEPDRLVAVKLVRSELSARDDLLGRFRREAQILAELDHPNIVRVLWAGDEQGWSYFVMDLVRGRDLAAAVDELSQAFAEHPARAADRIARITAELLETLAYAHGQGVVHRDLKPSNIMLDDDGHPHLVDFGLAKPFEDDAPDWNVRTVPGLLLGTPAYWSPEVAARVPFVREAPDIWAAGVILFQLLTGHLPYTGANTERLLARLSLPQCQDPRQLAPAVPSALAAICKHALAPDPGERYASAQEFAADLRRFLARQPTHAEARRPVEHLVRHVWRHRHRYGLGVLTGAVAAGVWLLAESAATRAATSDEAANLIAAVAGAGGPPQHTLPSQAARARELLASGRLGADQAEALAKTLGRIETEAREQRRIGREMIARGAGTPPGTPRAEIAAPNTSLQLRGVQIAGVAALVLGESEDELGLLGDAFPHLQIADPVGHGPTSFRIDSLEPVGGQPLLDVASGTTPTTLALPPGEYRIVVGDGAQFAECSRTLGPPGTTIVVPHLLASAIVQQDMIAIPAGTAVVGQDLAGAYIYAQQTIVHAAFLIDRTEVTCGAYHAFCVTTGAALPGKWNGTYDPAWQDLPVVGVSAAEATAYAEWCGKRLPTWTEWQIAARGSSGALFPWGNDPGPLATIAGIGGDQADWWSGVHPVGTVELDTSWCGAKDMLGNVDEWTSTPYVAQFDGMPFPVYPWRLRAGSLWHDPRTRSSALDVVSPGPPEWSESGFRCAKSSNP